MNSKWRDFLMQDLKKAIDLFQVDKEWFQETCQEYKKLFKGQVMDSLLIHYVKNEKNNLNSLYDMKEQFESPERMLYEHLLGMIATANTRSDKLPVIRANLGVGFIASIFGIEQRIFTDKMPWPQGHLSIEKIKELNPEDFSSEEKIKDKGLLPYACEIYQFYEEKLGTNKYFYIPDSQGVLDIAHLLVGDQLFYMMYDDPELVHHIMELSLQAYVSVSKFMKKIIGEEYDSGMHSGMALFNGGVRYCMDTTVLLNSEQIIEFEIPYLKRAFAEFGGGWVHFCGYAPHLVDILVEVPRVRGINPNYMVNQEHDYERDVKQMIAHDKFFFGAPFKAKEETTGQYFRRVLDPFEEKKGLVFTPRGEGLDLEHVEEIWRETQDEVFRI